MNYENKYWPKVIWVKPSEWRDFTSLRITGGGWFLEDPIRISRIRIYDALVSFSSSNIFGGHFSSLGASGEENIPVVVLDGAVFDPRGSLVLSERFDIDSEGLVVKVAKRHDEVEFTGSILGTGILTKQGLGSLILSGPTETDMSVEGGSLFFSAPNVNKIDDVSINVDKGTRFVFKNKNSENAEYTSFIGTLMGKGDIEKQEKDTLIIKKPQTIHSGNVIVSAGTLKMSTYIYSKKTIVKSGAAFDSREGGSLHHLVIERGGKHLVSLGQPFSDTGEEMPNFEDEGFVPSFLLSVRGNYACDGCMSLYLGKEAPINNTGLMVQGNDIYLNDAIFEINIHDELLNPELYPSLWREEGHEFTVIRHSNKEGPSNIVNNIKDVFLSDQTSKKLKEKDYNITIKISGDKNINLMVKLNRKENRSLEINTQENNDNDMNDSADQDPEKSSNPKSYIGVPVAENLQTQQGVTETQGKTDTITKIPERQSEGHEIQTLLRNPEERFNQNTEELQGNNPIKKRRANDVPQVSREFLGGENILDNGWSNALGNFSLQQSAYVVAYGREQMSSPRAPRSVQMGSSDNGRVSFIEGAPQAFYSQTNNSSGWRPPATPRSVQMGSSDNVGFSFIQGAPQAFYPQTNNSSGWRPPEAPRSVQMGSSDNVGFSFIQGAQQSFYPQTNNSSGWRPSATPRSVQMGSSDNGRVSFIEGAPQAFYSQTNNSSGWRPPATPRSVQMGSLDNVGFSFIQGAQQAFYPQTNNSSGWRPSATPRSVQMGSSDNVGFSFIQGAQQSFYPQTNNSSGWRPSATPRSVQMGSSDNGRVSFIEGAPQAFYSQTNNSSGWRPPATPRSVQMGSLDNVGFSFIQGTQQAFYPQTNNSSGWRPSATPRSVQMGSSDNVGFSFIQGTQQAFYPQTNNSSGWRPSATPRSVQMGSSDNVGFSFIQGTQQAFYPQTNNSSGWRPSATPRSVQMGSSDNGRVSFIEGAPQAFYSQTNNSSGWRPPATPRSVQMGSLDNVGFSFIQGAQQAFYPQTNNSSGWRPSATPRSAQMGSSQLSGTRQSDTRSIFLARPLLTNYLLKNDYQTEPNSIVNIFSSNCLEKCSLCNRNKEPESLNHKPVVSLYYEAKKIKKYKLKKGSRVSYNLQNSLTQNLFQTNVNTSHGLNSQSLQREVQDGNFQEPNLNPAGESVIQETDSEIKNTTSIALFQPNNLNLDAEKSRTQNDQGKTKAFSSVSELSNPSNLESENNIIDRPIALITPMLQPNESVSDRAERGGELLILEDSFSKESSSILDFLEDSEPMLDLQVEESTRSKEQNETLAEKNKNTTQTTIVCAINQRIQNFTADGKNLKHQPSQSQLVSDSDEAHQDFMLVGWQKKRQDANIQDFFISSREQDISTNGIELQTEELLLGTSAELDLDFHNSENSFSRTAAYGAWKRGSLHFSSIFVHENKTDRRQSKNNERLIHSVTEIGYHVEKPNILFGSFLILSGFSSNREESFQKKGLGFRIAGPLSSTDSSANIEYEFAIQHMFSAFGSEQEITGLIKLETESGANFAVAYKNSLESTETGLRLNIKF